eukprot:1161453-Pelagomonas_calceolata.AAC.5
MPSAASAHASKHRYTALEGRLATTTQGAMSMPQSPITEVASAHASKYQGCRYTREHHCTAVKAHLATTTQGAMSMPQSPITE